MQSCVQYKAMFRSQTMTLLQWSSVSARVKTAAKIHAILGATLALRVLRVSCPLSLAWAVAFCPPFDPSPKLVNNSVSSKLFLTLWTCGGEISTGLNNSRSMSLSLAPKSCWSFLDPPPEAFLVARVGVPGELSVGFLLEVFALLQVRLLFRDKTGNMCRDEIKFNAITHTDKISYTCTAKIEMHDVWEIIQLDVY